VIVGRHPIKLVEMSPRDAFPGYDEPVNIEGEPDDVLKVLLADEVSPGAEDVVDPVLDE